MIRFKAALAITLTLITTSAFAQEDQVQALAEIPLNKPIRDKLTNPNHWMAIIGDSGSTGAASDINLKASLTSLLATAAAVPGKKDLSATPPPLADFPNPERFNIEEVHAMNRVFYSQDEYTDALKANGVRGLNLSAKASTVFDVAEHANGYMIGRALDIKAEDIVLVGQGGARVNAIPQQFSRIFEMDTATLPPLVLMSFTANDFCNEKIHSDPMTQLRAWFDQSLTESWAKSERYMKAHPKGTKIVVLGALDVANVLTNEDVLSQRIEFQGMGEISCGQLRRGETKKDFFSRRIAESLISACKGVLATKPSDTARLDRIRMIQEQFNDVWKEQIVRLNDKYKKLGIEFVYVENTRDMRFAKGDVANDCFHPGVNGHAKIADYVLRTVFGK